MRWESGDDRRLLVDATDRGVVGGEPQGTVRANLVWRWFSGGR